MLRFCRDYFFLVRIDQPSKKVNYKFWVKGQEKVTRGQNVNFHSIDSKYYLSEGKWLMIVRMQLIAMPYDKKVKVQI